MREFEVPEKLKEYLLNPIDFHTASKEDIEKHLGTDIKLCMKSTETILDRFPDFFDNKTLEITPTDFHIEIKENEHAALYKNFGGYLNFDYGDIIL